MTKVRWSKSTLLLLCVLVVGLLLVRYSVIVYGGEEGLLKASIQNLFEQKTIQIEGNLKVESYETKEEALSSLYFQGEVTPKEGEVTIGLFLASEGSMEKVPVGDISIQEGIVHMNMDMLGESVDLPLENLITDKLSKDGDLLQDIKGYESAETVLEELMDDINVEERIIQDPRAGYHQLKVHVNTYIYENEQARITLNVNHQAKLLSIGMTVTGETLTLVGDVNIN